MQEEKNHRHCLKQEAKGKETKSDWGMSQQPVKCPSTLLPGCLPGPMWNTDTESSHTVTCASLNTSSHLQDIPHAKIIYFVRRGFN